MCPCVSVCPGVYVHPCVCVRVYVCACVQMHMYMCMCMCAGDKRLRSGILFFSVLSHIIYYVCMHVCVIHVVHVYA